jgi:hypothetical protein
MPWRILKPVIEDARRSENYRDLAALEGWSYEGLPDPATLFKNHLIHELGETRRGVPVEHVAKLLTRLTVAGYLRPAAGGN